MGTRAGPIDVRALGRLTRHPVCPTARLAELAGVPPRSLANAVQGLTGLSVPDLRLVLRAMVEVGQERDALDLVVELLDLEARGWELRPTARADASSKSLTIAVLDVGAEAGELAAEVRDAVRDGRIDAAEASEIRREARDVEYAAAMVEATARSLPLTQLALAEVG